MSDLTQRIRTLLASQPRTVAQLVDKFQSSQPTMSRLLKKLDAELIRFKNGQTVYYALRDSTRGLDDTPIYRVDAQGKIKRLGVLCPVRPDGFVMQQDDGTTLHDEGLPWWMMDMRPQGYWGHILATHHAQSLDLPANLSDWSDTHALQALVTHGHDAVGNLLLGDLARERFLSSPPPKPIAQAASNQLGELYAQLAHASNLGQALGSPMGGEQPKFTTQIQTPQGPRHVLVKFSQALHAGEDIGKAPLQPNTQTPQSLSLFEDELSELATASDAPHNPVAQRWRDLLLCEHHALQTLAAHGLPAASTRIVDHAGQRFLEVARFDRVGDFGRVAVLSLTALAAFAEMDAQKVGKTLAPWPVITHDLAKQGYVTPESAHIATELYAFGVLIGNTDMHLGNLSFTSEHGRPYAIAPAYDMLPMGFAPTAGAGLSNHLNPPQLHDSVPVDVWQAALTRANDWLQRLQADTRLSSDFSPCIATLMQHLIHARNMIARLG